MSQKRKVIKGTSPIGQAKWFKLITPDQKFKKYSVDLVLDDSEQVQNLINEIEELTQEAIKEAKDKVTDKSKLAKMKGDSGNRPYEKELDSEGNHTGRYILKFRGKSEGKKKDDTIYTVPAPALFDSKAKPISASDKAALKVPNGSLVQIAYELTPYYVASTGGGVSLRPTACMIRKLQQVEDATNYGFAASEFNSEDNNSEEDFGGSDESSSNEESDF